MHRQTVLGMYKSFFFIFIAAWSYSTEYQYQLLKMDWDRGVEFQIIDDALWKTFEHCLWAQQSMHNVLLGIIKDCLLYDVLAL